MENIATLQAIVTADISRFEQAMADVQKSGQGSMNFLSGLGDMGKALTLGLTVPLLGAGAAIAKIGMDFDANMRNINSLTQKGEEDFKAFSEEVNAFGSATTYGANKTAEALYNIVSAGIGLEDTAKAMGMLSVTTRLAESGRDDLDRTTAAMIALEGTYGKAGYSAERLGDITAQMVQTGVGSMNTYTQNLAKALPASINLGISYEELAGSIAILSQTYGNGSKPMTAIGMLTSNLMKPTSGLAAAYEELGVATGTDLINKFGGLMGALEALKGTMSQTDFQKSFSKTGFEAVLLLTNNIKGTNEELAKFYAKIDGSVERAWAEQMKSAAAAFDRAKAALEGVAIVLSTHLLPIIAPILDAVADMGNAFIAADPEIQRAVVVFGALAAAVGPVLWLFSTLVGSLSPIGLAMKAAALGAVAFATDFGGIATAIKDTADKAIAALKPLTDALTGFYNELFPEQANSDYAGGLVDAVNGVLGIADKIKLPNTGDMITVDKPTALWDIYKQKGYDKAFSWEEFKKEALEGGWKGGKAYLNPGEHIMIGDWQDPIDELGTFGDKLRDGWQDILDWVSDPNKIKADTFNDVLDDAGVVPTEIPFIERLKTAITNAWPGVSAALGTLWGQVTAWFDSTVGAGINWLAGLFTGTEANGGNTPIYEAVKALLNGDIYAAIDEVIPGAGTKLKDLIGGDWGAKVGEAFPEIKKGLDNLGLQFRSWFENDAVPSFAKSIGYFGGKIGVLIGQAIGAVGGFISGGGAGGAADGIAKGAGEFMGLVGEGFQDALTDSGVGVVAGEGTALENWANQIVTGIAGALGTATAVAGAFGLFTGGLWGAISGAMSVPFWFGLKALQMAGSVASAIMGALGMPITWATLGTTIWTAISTTIATFPMMTLALGAIAVSALVTGIYLSIPDEVKAQLQQALWGFINSIFGEGTGQGVSRGLEMVLYQAARNIAFVQGNTAGVEYFDGILAGMNGEQDKIDGAAKALTERLAKAASMGMSDSKYWTFKNPVTITEDGVTIDPALTLQWQAAIDEMIRTGPQPDWTGSTDGWWAKYQEALNMVTTEPLKAEFMFDFVINKGMDATDQAAFEAKLDEFLGKLLPEDTVGKKIVYDGVSFSLVPAEIVVDATGVTPTVTGVDTTTPLEVDVPIKWNFEAAGEGRIPGGVNPGAAPTAPAITADQVVDPAMPTEVAATMGEVNTTIDTNTQQWGITAAAQLNNGNLDADKIKTEFLDPLNTYWTTAFAPEGPMATTVKAFAEGFVLAMGDMGTALINLNTAVNDELTKFLETIILKETELTAAATLLKTNFNQQLVLLEANMAVRATGVTAQLDKIKTAVDALTTSLGALGTAMDGVGGMGVPTTPVVNGSHAGGLDKVPYDGYIGELHKDEMVLTAREAKQYRMGERSYSSSKTSNRTDNSTTVVNINGVQNVDGVVKELKRRGVKIG